MNKELNEAIEQVKRLISKNRFPFYGKYCQTLITFIEGLPSEEDWISFVFKEIYGYKADMLIQYNNEFKEKLGKAIYKRMMERKKGEG